MGYDIGLRQCGSINLAQSKDRMVALKRRMAYNIPTGLHCEVHNLFFTIYYDTSISYDIDMHIIDLI